MNQKILLNEIAAKSPFIGQELKAIDAYLKLDPEVAVSKSRKVLELIVSQIEHARGSDLNDRIQALKGVLPDTALVYMHFIRKLGNTAVHSNEEFSEQTAKDVHNVLIHLACWHLKIDPNSSSDKRARYFIADPIHRTWAKVAVLTDDGVLYSEYLTYMKPTKFKKSGFDFDGFNANDFSFGKEEHGHAYQSIREVSYQEASSYKLSSQVNWVSRYLSEVVGIE